jgi:pimeloyl-ACP methyl ester carboxylesterase
VMKLTGSGKWDAPMRQEHARQWQHDNPYQSLWSDVDQIACPTVVLRGADSAVQLDEDAELLAQRALGRWVRVPNAGHIVQRGNPAATSKP